ALRSEQIGPLTQNLAQAAPDAGFPRNVGRALVAADRLVDLAQHAVRPRAGDESARQRLLIAGPLGGGERSLGELEAGPRSSFGDRDLGTGVVDVRQPAVVVQPLEAAPGER